MAVSLSYVATKSFSCRCEVRSDLYTCVGFSIKEQKRQTSKLNNDSILRPCQMYSYEKKVYVYVVSVYIHI